MSSLDNHLGNVKLVQIQPNGLIIDAPGETPTGYLYDASRLVNVEKLVITQNGIEATLPDGSHALDIHHKNHPNKKYEDDDLVSIGFTSHYDAMRKEFGDHMVDGIAGENIIVEFDEEVWLADISKQIGIENQHTKEITKLEIVSFSNPCTEFSQFCVKDQKQKIPAKKLKKVLQFLGNGRRGYLFLLNKAQPLVTIFPGDKVYNLSN